jgi:phosphatidate cytidylyltransferase
MKRLLTAVVLIPIVLLLTFKAPLWLFAAVVAVVAMLAMREYMDLVVAYGYEPLRLTTYIVTPFYFALLAVIGRDVVGQESGGTFFLLGSAFVLPLAFLFALVGLRKDLRLALPSVAFTWAGFVLVVFALATLVFLRVLPLGPFYLLYLFVVVWSGDIVAFWVGTAVGKHKLAPRISPKKTWEGAVASVVTAALLGAAILYYSPQLIGWLQTLGAALALDWPEREAKFRSWGLKGLTPDLYSIPLWKALLWSALINVAAQFGDLVESMMKRGAGVKDSGAILPGHGGMLDRVDALLFAAPFGFAVILFAIHS